MNLNLNRREQFILLDSLEIAIDTYKTITEEGYGNKDYLALMKELRNKIELEISMEQA